MDGLTRTRKSWPPVLIAVLAVLALFLLSCEDSVGLESTPKVAFVSDLDSCTAENAGAAVFVEDERMLYTCGEEGWKAELEPAEYERNCGADVVSDDSVSKCGEGGTFMDSRDRRIYKCVKIGDQVWMAENLDFGEIVHSTTNQVKASAAHAQKYCYDDDSTNCAKYGGLYQWHTAMGLCAEYGSMDANALVGNPHRGICPAGWHVPTKEEWDQLVEFVRSPDSNDAGRALKSKTGWDGRQFCVWEHSSHDVFCNYEQGVSGTDLYGWNAIPSGFLGSLSHFVLISSFPKASYEIKWQKFFEDADEFWSATETKPNAAVKYSIGAFVDSVWSASADKAERSSRSLRCVQD